MAVGSADRAQRHIEVSQVVWPFVSKVGLVLGGGGVTGASWELAALFAIEMATGWDPNSAEVVVGTSAGAYVAALVREDALHLDTIARPEDTGADISLRIRSHLYRRTRFSGFRRWLRHGVLPGIRNPGLALMLGCPAPYDPSGISDWLAEQAGPGANGWPDRPTVIVAYDIAARKRVPFGTHGAPEVTLREAVAASSAIPMIFHPFEIEGKAYVDGGVASGTHADLVLGSSDPLDLVVVLAPLAAERPRRGAAFYELLLDHAGWKMLSEEVALIEQAWPDTKVLVLKPGEEVLALMRSNPMRSDAAVSSFVGSLDSMHGMLSHPSIWSVLEAHLSEVA